MYHCLALRLLEKLVGLLGFIGYWVILVYVHIKKIQQWKIINLCLLLIIFIASVQEQC